MADCQHCGRAQHDTAYICHTCAGRTTASLLQLSRLLADGDLDTTIARQDRITSGGGGGSVEAPLPINLGASARMAAVSNTLTTWARHIAEARGMRVAPSEQPMHGAACRLGDCRHATCHRIRNGRRALQGGQLAAVAYWLSEQCGWLRHQPEAAEAIGELDDAAAAAHHVVDRPAPRWYAGPCGQCGQHMYAQPGRDVVACRCGAQYEAAMLRRWLLDSARGTLVHAELLARAIVALGVTAADGAPVTPAQVRGMARRGRIAERGTDQAQRPLYRVGEVLDVLAEQARTARSRQRIAAAQVQDERVA